MNRYPKPRRHFPRGQPFASERSSTSLEPFEETDRAAPHGVATTTAARLMTELIESGEIAAERGSSALVFGAGGSLVPASLARRGVRVSTMDVTVSALDAIGEMLRESGLPAIERLDPLSATDSPPGINDMGFLEMPKSRKLARRWLLEAHHRIRLGGVLIVGGAKQEGIEPLVRDAQDLFGNSRVLLYRERNRVASCFRSSTPPVPPAWVGEPGIQPGSWYTWPLEIGGHTAEIFSLPGVFSFDRLDDGTALLLETLPDQLSGRALDLGCGAGVLATWAAIQGAEAVDAIDSSLYAVASTRETAARNGLQSIEVVAGEGVGPVRDRKYRFVLTNPPFHTGKGVDYEAAHSFVRGAATILEPGGEFWLVANRFIRYAEAMRSAFGNAEVVAQTGRYQVLRSRKRGKP